VNPSFEQSSIKHKLNVIVHFLTSDKCPHLVSSLYTNYVHMLSE